MIRYRTLKFPASFTENGEQEQGLVAACQGMLIALSVSPQNLAKRLTGDKAGP